jgi:hypothetical protein
LITSVALLSQLALVLIVLAATAWILGSLLVGELERAVERWAVSTALGLAALAHLGLLQGFVGHLRPSRVILGLVTIHVLGASIWRRLLATARPRWRWALLAMLALGPFLLLGLYPPTGFDATLYHLPFAKGFLASGSVPFLGDLRFPVFPQANEMLFALVMMFAPDIAAHGVEFLMTMVTAALVWAWARDAFSARAAGWLAAAAFLGNPIVAHLAGTAYIEAGLTLFVTAGLYAVRRWRESGERRWLVLSAVFAATAADVKYLGLFFVGVIGLTVLLGRFPIRDFRTRWTATLLFGVVALAVLAPWYERIYYWTGDPVFPFFPQVFDVGPWKPLRFASFLEGSRESAVAHAPYGFGARLIDLARLPWDVVFERAKYNTQPPFSPLYLLTLPLAVLAAWRDPRQRRLLALPALYAFICLALPKDSRYLVPVLPLLSVSAAGALLAVLPQRRTLIAALCAGCFLPGWLYTLYRFQRQGPPPLTPASREAYLARKQPVYPAVAYLNRTLGSGYTVWAVHAENMQYYARGRFLGDWIGRARFDRVLADLRTAGDLHARLRGLGADHLLIPRDKGGLKIPEDATFRRWFLPVYSDPHAEVYRLRERED